MSIYGKMFVNKSRNSYLLNFLDLRCMFVAGKDLFLL